MSRKVVVSATAALAADFETTAEWSRELRRADQFIRMAVICGQQAMNQAPEADLDAVEKGVFIGTAYGPLETNFESLGSLIDNGEGQISPTLFSHSVYNAAAGYVTRLLDIQGPALTITAYSWPLLIALNEARMAVACGRIERALVIGVETYSDLLADAYKRSYNTDCVPWHRGAVALVVDPANEPPTGCCCLLEDIVIKETKCDPADYLTRKGETWQGEGLAAAVSPHPMAYAYAVTRALAGMGSGGQREIVWRIRASFGRAEIKLKVQGV